MVVEVFEQPLDSIILLQMTLGCVNLNQDDSWC
jgi:hypothetical protein